MPYNVLVEGQTIPVPDEIGASDEAVKRALAPFYPEVANALITRVEKDGVVTINVVKRAGSKGNLDQLLACPAGQNPAIALYEEFQRADPFAEADPYQLLELDTRIAEAVKEGERQGQAVDHALKRLIKSAPRRANHLVQGF